MLHWRMKRSAIVLGAWCRTSRLPVGEYRRLESLRLYSAGAINPEAALKKQTASASATVNMPIELIITSQLFQRCKGYEVRREGVKNL